MFSFRSDINLITENDYFNKHRFTKMVFDQRDCPYNGCKLKCRTEGVHRARYASISRGWQKKVLKLDQEVRDQVQVEEVHLEAQVISEDQGNIDLICNERINQSPSHSHSVINIPDNPVKRSTMIDYEKLKEMKILWCIKD